MDNIKYFSDLADSAIKDTVALEKICAKVVKTIKDDLQRQSDRSGYSQRIR